jgi:ADP-ribose pyrophosphatase YjhB (NUDIX family)
MPVRVKVRAVIWIDGRIVVHRDKRHGRLHVTLPGGRVNERESVTDALQREVREELGVTIELGDLLFAGEVHSGVRYQDVELVFAASLTDPRAGSGLDLVDPAAPDGEVLPPVLDRLVVSAGVGDDRRWLGNLYAPRESSPDR